MARTALREQFGGSVDKAMTSDYQLRLPSGVPGAARFYVLRPSLPGLDAILPDARLCRMASGGAPAFVIANMGSESLTIKDSSLATLATVGVTTVAQMILANPTTAAGTWVTRTVAGAVESSAIANEVDEFTIALQTGTNVDIRNLCDQQGYAGILPARVTATLADVSGIGSTTTAVPSLYSGVFPAGSVLLLTIGSGAVVAGIGGWGGGGGNPAPIIATGNGAAGGIALDLAVDTVLTNYGKIQGGGGGGGGGDYVGLVVGPGGGGGAGYNTSAGGYGGGIANAYGSGGNGTIGSPGFGGAVGGGVTSGFGGVGGGPGAAGGVPSLSGGTGGAAGAAIRRLSAVTLTKLVAGTIDGPEIVI